MVFYILYFIFYSNGNGGAGDLNHNPDKFKNITINNPDTIRYLEENVKGNPTDLLDRLDRVRY